MILSQKSDLMGSVASGLCFVHCLASPFLFVAQAGNSVYSQAVSGWWGRLDYLFLILSLWAVYQSAKTTSKTAMKYALWTSWVILASLILNEKMEAFHIMEEAIYVPALTLVFLHLYNRKYCQCEDEACCVQAENQPAKFH